VGTLNIAGISFAPSGSIGISGNALANLNVNSSGSLTASSDIYASDILLAGTLNFYGADNLTIHGNFAGSGAGVINVGSKSQTIDGDFTLNSGDELATTLKSGGVGNLTVSGSATIDSNSKLAITTSSSQGYISDGTQYSLVSAGSSSSISSISDSNISVNGASSNIYGLLKFSTAATSDSLVLNIDRLSATEITSNTNAQNIYQTITDIGSSSSGKLLEFQEYLDSSGLTGNAITSALNQLAPQSSKAALATTNNVVSNSIKITESRLEKTRHSNAPKVLKNGFWAQGFGGSALQKEIANDAGYKANSAGLSFGVDKEISDSVWVGTAFSLAKSGVKLLDSSKQNLIDTYQINFYRSENFGKYFFDSVAGLAWNHFDSNRAITKSTTRLQHCS
jgi:outer membrane autotransporter protein